MGALAIEPSTSIGGRACRRTRRGRLMRAWSTTSTPRKPQLRGHARRSSQRFPIMANLSNLKDWKKVAADALNAPSWKEAAKQYHRDRAGRPLIVEIEPEHLKRLRRLMDQATSLERAWDKISRKNGGAPQATVEAFMFSLRSRGT